MTDQTPSPVSPVATQVIWSEVVGEQLEELLWALVEEMGATDMMWRAGSANGVNAADGGRDIEATFTEPTEDGNVEKRRWWFEAKGRAGTISKDLVMSAAMTALAYPEVDVVAVCSNSVFSNPTLDWVREWNGKFDKPKLFLWDRAKLGILVRRYPLAAARILPEALADSQRLDLLLSRFEHLGELPSPADQDFFWTHRESIREHGSLVQLVTMFVYGEDNLSRRPWTGLLPSDSDTAVSVITRAVVILPFQIFHRLARPLDGQRVIRSAALMFASVINNLDADQIAEILDNPPISVSDGEDQTADNKAVEIWKEAFLPDILNDLQLQLRDVCATDCARVIADPAAFPPAVDAEEYFRRLGWLPPRDGRQLLLLSRDTPCAVGFPLDRDEDCALTGDIEASAELIRQFQRILSFRRKNPTGQFLRIRGEMDSRSVGAE